MGKKNNNEAPKAKKGPDITGQKVKKARNALKSGGKRGLDAYLSLNGDIKGHAEVKKLLNIAAKLPDRPVKGKRGPKPISRKQPVEQQEMQPA